MTENNNSNDFNNWSQKLPQVGNDERTRNRDINSTHRTQTGGYGSNRINASHHEGSQADPRRVSRYANQENRNARYSDSRQRTTRNPHNSQNTRSAQRPRPQGYNPHSQYGGTRPRNPHAQATPQGRNPRRDEYQNQESKSQLEQKLSKLNIDPRILGIVCVICVVVVGVLFIGALGQASVNNQEASADSQEIDPDQVVNQEQSASTQETNVNAVDPNNVPGSSKSSDEKVVYLTFDDGPSELTPQVLDILDKYNAKATFFVVGHSEEHFYLIAEEAKRGHTVGMHTYTHDYEQVYASDEAYFDDLNKISQVVKDQIGYVPAYIRFPGGSSNTVSAKYCSGIMSRLVDSVHEKGFQYYDWNVSSGDGSKITTDAEIDASIGHDDFNNIVLLCHDSATKQSTVEALPSIIEYYQQRGYAFKGIDRSTFDAHHTPQN